MKHVFPRLTRPIGAAMADTWLEKVPQIPEKQMPERTSIHVDKIRPFNREERKHCQLEGQSSTF
jgi:hypothetical protein